MPTAATSARETTNPGPVPAWSPPKPATSLGPMHRRMTLPLEGRYWLLAAVGLWLTGWLKGINLVLVLAYLLLLLGVLNWLAARRALHGAVARRKARGPIFAGTPVSWEVEATVEGRRPLTGWEVVDEGPDHSLRWFLLNVAPGEQVRLRRDVCLPRRGPYVCRPLRAVSSFPFGLVRHEVAFGGEERITVLPRLGQIHLGRLRRWLMQSARPDERSRRTRRRLASEAEFHGLRQFRPGDSPRWIHWRTTARTGELVVREFDQGSHHDLLLLVEPFAWTADSNDVESAVRLAATICWAWSREAGDRVILAVIGPSPIAVAGGDGPAAVIGLLEILAGLQGAPTADLDGLERQLQRVSVPAGAALLVSSRPDASTAEELSLRLDRPVAFLSAIDPPSFYQPPA
jgi:uncharacterized protein (DUF58 family)